MDAYDVMKKKLGRNHEFVRWLAMKLEREGWVRI